MWKCLLLSLGTFIAPASEHGVKSVNGTVVHHYLWQLYLMHDLQKNVFLIRTYLLWIPPQVVNKYFCSFLWCAFSRVSTGTLSWLEGTLQALQRINIRASISRATKMLHTIATTAAVESPVVDTESSQSHSCIADTVKASFRSTGRRRGSDPWPVIDARRDAVNFKGRLVDITVTLSLFFFLWGSSCSSDPAWRRASYFLHLLSSHIDDTPFVERRGRRVCRGCVIWNGCKTQSSFAGWIYFSADCGCRAHARIWFER